MTIPVPGILRVPLGRRRTRRSRQRTPVTPTHHSRPVAGLDFLGTAINGNGPGVVSANGFLDHPLSLNRQHDRVTRAAASATAHKWQRKAQVAVVKVDVIKTAQTVTACGCTR